MRAWSIVLLGTFVAACADAPVDDATEDLDGDGKADGVMLVSKRRRLVSVPCPADDAPMKVAFFDADSTLRVSKSGAVTANGPTDVNVLPLAARELRRLHDEGYVIAIVSNQGGIAAGHQTFESAEKALAFTVRQLRRLGGPVNWFDFAEKNDRFRKPNIGMAELLESRIQSRCGVGIDRTNSLMVGDSGYKRGVDGPHPDGRPADDFSNADRGFAENFGIPFHEPTDYFGWRAYDVFNIASQAELSSLVDAIEVGGDVEEAEQNRLVNGL